MSTPLRLSPLRLIGGVFCIAFLLAFLLGVIVGNRFLFQAFAATEAHITRVDLADHDRVYYSYTVNGTNFTGRDTGSVWTGTTIKVFYLLSDPAVSTTDDPSGGFAEIFRRALLSGTVLSIMMAVMAYGYAFIILAIRGQPPTA